MSIRPIARVSLAMNNTLLPVIVVSLVLPHFLDFDRRKVSVTKSCFFYFYGNFVGVNGFSIPFDSIHG